MKNLSKFVLSAFMVIMVFSLISTVNVNAIESTEVAVSGDSIQTQLQSNDKTTFLFRERTKLTICTDVEMDIDINCEAGRIGAKDFMIEVVGDHGLQMSMTCTREEQQLGLMKGNTYRIRNRYQYTYQEGFCVSIECDPKCDCICECQDECQCDCDCTCDCDCICECQDECQCDCDCDGEKCFTQAKLKIKATIENREGKWAYYDESNKEWETVPTRIEDGYLTAETDHFSTWTVLIPTVASNTILIIGGTAIFAFIGVLIGTVLHFRKRNL